MTDQNTIPADKVRELKTKYEYDTSGDPERLLDHLLHDLDDLLPAPAQPTTGLLGRWAKHDDYGDVVCVGDKPDSDGEVWVRWVDEGAIDGVNGAYVSMSSLTFPHQATNPADVPAGEAWRIKTIYGEFNAIKAPKGYFDNEDGSMYPWIVCNEGGEGVGFTNDITLIAPLTPERPVSGLQAKYDELEAKYRGARERIKTLERERTPITVSTELEYAALPIGSIASQPDTLNMSHAAFKKRGDNRWEMTGSKTRLTDGHMAQMNLTVLQYGRGDSKPELLPPFDEQPAWRIEHDHTNLRVGEYIIDIGGDDGTLTRKWGSHWDTDGDTYVAPCFAPFIVFPNKGSATPEAIAEAKRARDKETGE